MRARWFEKARVDTATLCVPDLLPEEHGLTRPQVAALEAIHILSLGIQDVAVDERALGALAWKSWGYRVTREKQLKFLKSQKLVFECPYGFWSMSPEGRVEHYAARVGVFA